MRVECAYEKVARSHSDWYKRSTKMSNQPEPNTPHDVILKVSDLKSFIGWVVAGCVTTGITVLGIIGAHFQSRLVEIEKHDVRQDSSIQTLVQQSEYSKDQLIRIQNSVEASQRNQSEILVQLSALRANASATEEISRSTQKRVEVLADYLRKNSKITSDSGVDTFDSVGRRLKQPD